LMNSVEVDGNSERFKMESSSRKSKHNDDLDVSQDDLNKHKTTLTIVQDFPKKPTESQVSNVEMVDIQTYDVSVIDHKDNEKTVLTIVQDFAKKHKKEQFSSGIELSKSRDIEVEDDNHKKTTLTIVQDFPKKIAEQSGHSIEFVEMLGMTPNINTYELEWMGL
jgi:hypothetical protein